MKLSIYRISCFQNWKFFEFSKLKTGLNWIFSEFSQLEIFVIFKIANLKKFLYWEILEFSKWQIFRIFQIHNFRNFQNCKVNKCLGFLQFGKPKFGLKSWYS